MKMISTRDAGVDRLKVLVHGPAGSGKTYLASTTGSLDKTLVLSAEAGLLSLRKYDIKAVEITSFTVLRESFSWLKGGCPDSDGKPMDFEWVILDSISEIAENCLSDMKNKYPDGRQAYGEMGDMMLRLLKGFRDLPYNVVMTCKQERAQDASGMMLYGPSLPGKMLTQNVSETINTIVRIGRGH